MLTLTFRAAKMARACLRSYEKFAKFKGGVTKWGTDKPFPLLEVLDNNGLQDALWALNCCRPTEERDRISRLFACDCSERVLPIFEKQYPEDKRPRQAIEVARRFANGKATLKEIEAASLAAHAAYSAAYWAAYAAAYWAAYAAYAAYAACLAAQAACLAAQAAGSAEREWQEKHFREMISE